MEKYGKRGSFRNFFSRSYGFGRFLARLSSSKCSFGSVTSMSCQTRGLESGSLATDDSQGCGFAAFGHLKPRESR